MSTKPTPTMPPGNSAASGGTPARTARGVRTRAALVHAASAHFADHGFDAATTADIAAHADVSEATLFLHFRSKAGLLRGVMRAYYDALSDDTRHVVDVDSSPRERLQALTRFWVHRMYHDWSLVRVFIQRGRFGVSDEVTADFREHNRRFTRIATGVLRDAYACRTNPAVVPQSLLRDVFFGAVEHSVVTARGLRDAGRGEPDLDAIAAGLATVLLEPAVA